MANEIVSGCRRVVLYCALKLAKKRKKKKKKTEMKRSTALSTLRNGSFRKDTLTY